MLTFHTAGLVVAVLLAVIAKLASGWPAAVGAFLVVFAISVLVGSIRRFGVLYTITDRRLHIRRGLLSRNEQHTSIDRIQNVNTTQTLFERILRIGTIDFDTAGTDDAEFQFAGVASPRHVVAAVDRAQQAAIAQSAAQAQVQADVIEHQQGALAGSAASRTGARRAPL